MTNVASIPDFKISEVFPARDPIRVAQVRLMIASQALAAFGRILKHLPRGAGSTESEFYLFTMSIGAANEAAMAFRDADNAGALDELLASGWEEISEAVERLRKEADKDNENSLWKRLIVVARNTVAFHWDPKIIGRSLEQLSSERLPVWSGGDDESVARTAFPIVARLVMKALETRAGSRRELNSLVSRLADFQADLFDVATAVYSRALLEAHVDEEDQ